MYAPKTPLIEVPLGTEAHAKAREWAAESLRLAPAANRREVGKRVYLNTLAVWAVSSYLKWLGYPVAMDEGDSANCLLSSRWDIADLRIPEIGQLECRWVGEGEALLHLPRAATSERVGYIGVQFGEVLNSARLLGFVPAMNPSYPPQQLQVAELLPLADLVDYLDRLETANQFFQGSDLVAARVREVLATTEFSEIVAQLERIYRTTEPMKWRYAGANILADQGASSGTERDFSEFSGKTDLQKLAQSLMDKLAELWRLGG